MSGGVDSAVCAYLLKEEGYDVIGLTLRNWQSSDGEESRCCEIDDARCIADHIGFPFYTFNCISEFEQKVTKPFICEYINGNTPNPCIECNRYVKWERMLYFANIRQADFIATGHYASVIKLDNGRYTVKKALHAAKDQTYMLYKLSQEQLSRTLMPLGKYSKDEVREILERYKDYDGKGLFPFTSQQQYNIDIKEMFKQAGLCRVVTVLNPTTREEEKRPLYEVASSHMARRTFVGNLYKQVKDPNLICPMSGHKEGSRAFARYREIDEELMKETVNLLE